MTHAWLMAPHEYEPDYGAYMIELDLLEASMANVATYDDWFPDERPTVAQQQFGGWTKKRKGTAKVHTHPDAYEGRAVVENHWGVHFNGRKYPSLDEAKSAALRPPIAPQ